MTRRARTLALIGLIAWIAVGLGSARTVVAQAPDLEAQRRVQAAVATQAATRARLRVLGDASSCPEARFVSYRRSDAEPDVVDQWYVASQLWADALLLAVRPPPAPTRVTPAPATPQPIIRASPVPVPPVPSVA